MGKQYFGNQTKLALGNFPFSFHRVKKELLVAITEIKKAAALANYAAGILDKDRADAIIFACDEVSTGQLDGQFPLSVFQGGAGTSINMNVNEVVASRAQEILESKGKKFAVHPNDHVNKSQSTNDVNPSALKLASLKLGKILLGQVDELVSSLSAKAVRYKGITKLARTHLQDAIPTTVGDEFSSWASAIERDKKRVEEALSYLEELNLGGTAIGNSVNAPPVYIKEVYKSLNNLTGFTFRPAGNFMSQTASQADFCMISQSLVLLTLDASKIASDIRLLSSGPNGGLGELTLVELQSGSSIMPGKVNPVLPEAVNQLYFMVSGNNLTIEKAAEASQLELGVMFPILADRLLESLVMTGEVLSKFSTSCIATLSVNEKNCRLNLERSTAYATLLTPKLGYDTVSQIVKESVKSGKTIRELVMEKHLMSEAEFDKTVE